MIINKGAEYKMFEQVKLPFVSDERKKEIIDGFRQLGIKPDKLSLSEKQAPFTKVSLLKYEGIKFTTFSDSNPRIECEDS